MNQTLRAGPTSPHFCLSGRFSPSYPVAMRTAVSMPDEIVQEAESGMGVALASRAASCLRR
jgi:hypothetical protein